MDILSAILLGAVQGLTEFLPISSSGHLILVRAVLDLQTADGLAVDAILQLATALAVGIYFWRDLADLARTAFRKITARSVDAQKFAELSAVMVGTVPAVIFGLLLEEYMETIFRSPMVVVFTLIVGGALMYFAEMYAKGVQETKITWKRGLLVGLFQCLALVPGMSRSGSTISGGLFVGLSRFRAARFSFLLSFPIITGSGIKKLLDLSAAGSLSDIGLGLPVGFITAFAFGLTAIHFLLRYLQSHSLKIFVVYRICLALLVLGLLSVF